MSAVGDALKAVKEALLLADEIKRTAAGLSALALEVRQHDRRITRLEAQWETAMRFTATNANAPRLPDQA